MENNAKAVTTFMSTHYAIQAEGVFRENNISFKTIPTPREITYSCGLALMFELEDVDKVKELVDKEELSIDSLYKYRKRTANPVEKIL